MVGFSRVKGAAALRKLLSSLVVLGVLLGSSGCALMSEFIQEQTGVALQKTSARFEFYDRKGQTGEGTFDFAGTPKAEALYLCVFQGSDAICVEAREIPPKVEPTPGLFACMLVAPATLGCMSLEDFLAETHASTGGAQ